MVKTIWSNHMVKPYGPIWAKYGQTIWSISHIQWSNHMVKPYGLGLHIWSKIPMVYGQTIWARKIRISALYLKYASPHGKDPYGVVVSIFGLHRCDRGLNPGQGGEISE